MDGGPTLKLVIEKGPREGESLEFKPGSTIHVGRVIRGNNITIKDPGISSKHIFVEFKSDSKLGQWFISDLESSNGTVLNDSNLSPFVPTVLSHGDTIKIGECTSITVNFVQPVISVGNDGNVKDNNQVRRNPRRRAAAKNDVVSVIVETRSLRGRGKVNLVGENSELGTGKERRDELKKVKAFENEDQVGGIAMSEVGEKENLRLVEPKLTRLAGTRKATRSKKDDYLTETSIQPSEIPLEKVEEVKNVDPIDVRMMQKLNSSGTDNSMKGDGLSMDELVKSRVQDGEYEIVECEVKGNVPPLEARQASRVSTRRTRNMKQGESLHVDEIKKAGRGVRKARKNIGDDVSESVKDDCVLEEVNFGDEDGENFQENLLSETMEAARVEVEKKSSIEIDLDKITLGEWFDYLEVYLPKQIHFETEELISAMGQKAEQFHEFMLQQKNLKDAELTLG